MQKKAAPLFPALHFSPWGKLNSPASLDAGWSRGGYGGWTPVSGESQCGKADEPACYEPQKSMTHSARFFLADSSGRTPLTHISAGSPGHHDLLCSVFPAENPAVRRKVVRWSPRCSIKAGHQRTVSNVAICNINIGEQRTVSNVAICNIGGAPSKMLDRNPHAKQTPTQMVSNANLG